jgi:hypothetical protein
VRAAVSGGSLPIQDNSLLIDLQAEK